MRFHGIDLSSIFIIPLKNLSRSDGGTKPEAFLKIYFCFSAPGGTASGTCASGFGVCCTLTGRCGGSTSINNTYFVANGGDTSPCSFKVCKSSDDICQIRSYSCIENLNFNRILFRLGFDLFSISQPVSEITDATIANSRTQCQRATFTATNEGPSPPTICGTNTGYHMILEVFIIPKV